MNGNTDKKLDKPKILYIGSDKSYFLKLKEQFSLKSSIDLEFKSAFSNDPKVIQSFVNKIKVARPKIVIIDLSNNRDALLHLARVWNRQNHTIKIKLIALCNYKQGQETIIKSILASIACIHIKSSEFSAVIYDIIALAFPDRLESHGYALAPLDDEVKAYFPAKVNKVSDKSISLESNIPIIMGAEVAVHSYFSKKKITKTPKMKMTASSDRNLYYNYSFAQTFDFEYMPPIISTDDIAPADLAAMESERQDRIANIQFQLKKWLKERAYDSAPKFLKAYVLDKKGNFFENAPLTDTYPFVLRCQPFIENAQKELKKIKPNIIIYNLEELSEAEMEANAEIANTFNDTRMLQHLVKTCNLVLKEELPLIIVFSARNFETDYLKQILNYKNVIAIKEDIDPVVVLAMTEKIKGKFEKNYPKRINNEVYFGKDSPMTFAEIEASVNILGVSENDIYFDSDVDIPLYTTMRIFLPKPVIVTIIEPPQNAAINTQYYGLINGIGESERKSLRQFINAVFFRDKDLAKEQDLLEFQNKKQSFIDDKKEEEASNIKLEAERIREQKEAEVKKQADADALAEKIASSVDKE